ncbi:MAG: prmC [Proteobacteria bacterium]|nr:prmC [Pseudomonadota bacterium]
MDTRIDGLLLRARRRLEGASESPALDAELLLAHTLGLPRMQLRTHGERQVAPADVARFESLVGRRAAGEPVAYLTGRRGFWTIDVAVGPAVLVPRPETERLVEAALERLRPLREPAILDLGTGSGAIALALASELPGAEVVAVEASAAALGVARANAAAAGLSSVVFLQGHWFEPVGKRRFDCIVANPPYLAGSDPHLASLAHEPESALVAGPTGLESLKEIIGGAGDHLREGGWLLLEHGAAQGAAVRGLCASAGLGAPLTLTDLAGLERVTVAHRAARP